MTKFLVDQNLSPKIVNLLINLGLDAKRVTDVGLSGADDEKIAEYAVANKFVLVTLDTDFGYLYYFVTDGLSAVVVRPKVPTSKNIGSLLEDFLSKIEHKKLERSLVILKESGYKIIPPES